MTALVYWWVWGAVNPLPAIHDEGAYLLQARLFASGHWTAPARPLPEFFDQFYVLVTPVLASRFPPGHSLLLSLGQAIGFPVLVPLVLSGLTGALLLGLATRLSGLLAGALAWILWLVAPINLAFRPTYLSNLTTGATWMLGWWALLRWSESRGRRWMVVIGTCVGWCIITRPLTGLVFAFSLVWPVLAVARRTQAWRQAGAGVLVALAVAVILPLANQRTTGSWWRMPWLVYSRQYMPYDRMGFGLDSTPPARPINHETAAYNRMAMEYRRAHVPRALPGIAADRLARIAVGMWGPALLVLLPAAVLGVVKAPRQSRLALGAAVLLVAAHLGYAHAPQWTVYYTEVLPVLAFFTAVGLAWLLAPAAGTGPTRGVSRFAAAAILVLWFLNSTRTVVAARGRSLRLHRPITAFAQKLTTIRNGKAVVFVREGQHPSLNRSLVLNAPDLRRAPIWVVHDLGPRNAELLSLARGRTAYMYDATSRTLLPLLPSSTGDDPPPGAIRAAPALRRTYLLAP